MSGENFAAHFLFRLNRPDRDRTCDLGIKSPLLYHLSYRPVSGVLRLPIPASSTAHKKSRTPQKRANSKHERQARRILAENDHCVKTKNSFALRSVKGSQS